MRRLRTEEDEALNRLLAILAISSGPDDDPDDDEDEDEDDPKGPPNDNR